MSIDLEKLPPPNGTPTIHTFEQDYCFLRFRGLPTVMEKKEEIRSNTWTFPTGYEIRMASYVFEKALRARADDWDELTVKERADYEFDCRRKAPILKQAVAVAIIDRRIVRFEINEGIGNSNSITVSSGNHDISDLICYLNDTLHRQNPLRGKLIQILFTSGDFEVKIQPTPAATLDDFITTDAFRADLRENSVYQLQLQQCTGLIFFGPPGTNKSQACCAIAHEAIQAGYSAVFLVGSVPFDVIDRVLRAYLAPAVVILEDIDTFSEDRLRGRPTYFADFLQFMNGISERDEAIVVIATTNHLDLLDDAIKNRPVRFNRKYEFRRPTNAEISIMIDRWFGTGVITSELAKLCYDRNLTGAHIREIHRTALTSATKEKKSLAEVFPSAVEVVCEHFVTEWKAVGFSAR